MQDRHLEGCVIYPRENVVKTHCFRCQGRLNGHIHVWREVKRRNEEWVSVSEHLCAECCPDLRCAAEREVKSSE